MKIVVGVLVTIPLIALAFWCIARGLRDQIERY